MRLQVPVALGFVFGIEAFLVGLQRHFAVDDEVLVVGKLNDEVGPLLFSLIVAVTVLRVKMNILVQPRAFENGFQAKLPPVTLGLVATLERIHKVVRILRKLLIEFSQFLDLNAQGQFFLRIVHQFLFDPLPEILHFFAQRSQQGFHLVAVVPGERRRFFFQQLICQIGKFQLRAPVHLREFLFAILELFVRVAELSSAGGEAGIQIAKLLFAFAIIVFQDIQLLFQLFVAAALQIIAAYKFPAQVALRKSCPGQ